jgi:ribonuclease P protein component
MKKNKIIKESSIFDDVIKNGKLLKNRYYKIFYLENNLDKPLFGFAVGKKIGNAVTRNKNKRQIKAIIDENISLFSNPCYYIIMLKKEINEISFQDKKESLISLLSKGDKHEK